MSPITPNMLVNGRNGRRAPIYRDINLNELPDDRLSYIEELERSWWYQYKVQYFRSLIPHQKWIGTKRNVCIGDIVLIEYKCKSFPGTYQLGRVNEVEVDSNDGLVRTCTVVYNLSRAPQKICETYLLTLPRSKFGYQYRDSCSYCQLKSNSKHYQ